MRWLRATGVVLAFAVGLCVAGLSPGRNLRGRMQMRWFRGLSRILGVRVPALPVPEAMGGELWVANHISWLDVVVLGAQRPLTFVAKREVSSWPVIGFLARSTGTLFVERRRTTRNGRTMADLRERLRRGETVLLFPEGTTKRGGNVKRFRSGLFQAAVDANAAVVPLALSYHGPQAELVPFVGDDAFVPHLWRLLGGRVLETRLSLGRALAGPREREALAAQSWECVSRLLSEHHSAALPKPEELSARPVEPGCLVS